MGAKTCLLVQAEGDARQVLAAIPSPDEDATARFVGSLFPGEKFGPAQAADSVTPDEGVMEDMGPRMAFELPYWSGAHPAVDPDDESDSYPLPFHPLELGEAALRELFGFQLEGYLDAALLEPERIRMLRFEPPGRPPRSAWWKFW